MTQKYVSVSTLADRWGVGRRMVYKQIEAGTLHAIKLGPRCLRVAWTEVRRFEREARLHGR